MQSSSKIKLFKPIETSDNVSKVMLNVDVTETLCSQNEVNREHYQRIIANEDPYIQGSSISDVEKRSSELDTTNTTNTSNTSSTTNTTKTNVKQISIVDTSNDCFHGKFEIDEDDVSKQVNEIIDEAVKINEAKLNAENQQKNTQNDKIYEQANEINNNNGHFCNHAATEKEIMSSQNQYEKPLSSKCSPAKHDRIKVQSTEVPIQPILNETRTFDFHEYSDHSLPTSTTSTFNTTETPSTEPESLITSDIEDGYKGNSEKLKNENNYEDSKEDFIESQFGFLKEHLDNKASNDSDDEQAIDSIKRCNIISSTLITDKFSETYDIPPFLDKSNVINELTHVISSNRLDKIIKPNNETHNVLASGQRSSLTNFHIGAYLNGNSPTEATNSTDFANGEPKSKQNIPNEDNISNQLMNQAKRLAIVDDRTDQIQSKTFTMPKQINRSMSFHSTFAIPNDRAEHTENSNFEPVLTTSLSNVSLNGNLKPNKQVDNGLEPRIADTPSLQSIEIMKTILNSSFSKNPDLTVTNQHKQILSNAAITQLNDNQRDFQANKQNEVNAEGVQNSNAQQLNMKSGSKTWKYQGPPAINLSTWGERPKSLVHIKSDNDYVVSGTSKFSALQKRFSGTYEGIPKDAKISDGLKNDKTKTHYDNGSCKLPIVRSVEYKKNMQSGDTFAKLEDAPDSVQKCSSFRPSYEISHIYSDKSGATQSTAILDRSANTIQSSDSMQAKSFSSNPRLVHRVQSLNEQSQILPNNQCKEKFNDSKQNGALEKPIKKPNLNKHTHTKETEKPIFSQFTLRKTGFKEKILDECNSNTNLAPHKIDTKIIGNVLEANQKANPLMTAPKPPPMQKNALNHPKILCDPRDQLLDSIRNFNRGALKRN